MLSCTLTGTCSLLINSFGVKISAFWIILGSSMRTLFLGIIWTFWFIDWIDCFVKLPYRVITLLTLLAWDSFSIMNWWFLPLNDPLRGLLWRFWLMGYSMMECILCSTLWRKSGPFASFDWSRVGTEPLFALLWKWGIDCTYAFVVGRVCIDCLTLSSIPLRVDCMFNLPNCSNLVFLLLIWGDLWEFWCCTLLRFSFTRSGLWIPIDPS